MNEKYPEFLILLQGFIQLMRLSIARWTKLLWPRLYTLAGQLKYIYMIVGRR